jgi:archaellum component FlaC
MDSKQFNKLIEAIDTRIDARFDEFRETLMTKKEFNEKIDKVYNMLDSISERIDTDEGERAAIISQTNRSEERINKLDKRVTRLEKATI